MEYKGYEAARIELDEDTGTIHGRVALSRAMATFQGDSVAEAARAFRDSVDDYLAMCAEHGIEPEPPSAAVTAERGLARHPT